MPIENPHPWSSLVLGGVGTPRLLICSENWCTNPYFSSSLSDWDISESPSIVRVEDEYAYDQYMAHLAYTADNQYVRYAVQLSSSADGRSFIANLRVRSMSQTFRISLVQVDDGDPTNYVTFGSWVFSQTGTAPERVTVAGTCPGVVGDGTIIGVQIWPHYELPVGQGEGIVDETPVSWDPGDGNIYFDDLYLTEVTGDFSFPQPNTSYLQFIESTIGQNQLWSGMVQKFNRRFSPKWIANYEALDVLYEQYRSRIAESKAIFCIPHIDVAWGFLGYWSGEFDRRYAFDRFIAHESPFEITGQEYFINKPEIKAGDVGYVYVEDDLIIIP